jgi:hypothetical protein
MPKLTLLPDEISGEIETGTHLLQCAEMLGVELLHSCGGIAESDTALPVSADDVHRAQRPWPRFRAAAAPGL